MSHFLHRSKVSSPAVAGEVSTPMQRKDAALRAGADQGVTFARRQAQMHMPRTNILKPPVG